MLGFVQFPWFGARKTTPSPVESPSIQLPPPLPHIVDAFRRYIHNDIPARLIDTSTMTFVERDDVFNIFYADIAQVSEVDVQRHMDTVSMDPEAGNYISARKTALQETIRDVVKYAIFSHRWGAHEPSYQNVSALVSSGSVGRHRSAENAGLAKLVQLCETARAMGYRFVWSDACCIDKTSMAELSEAIHAMYKWYAHSHLCIVHLAGSSSLEDFEHEPWFTRGWTLQELLAPRRIKFFDKRWRPFTNLANDKADEELMYTLFTVTRIPRDVIVADNSHGITGHGVWEILSWASKRKTSRIEDAAYCLFGLFDVHPPIAYGEGDNAFPRLVEMLVERYHAWDVFAWSGVASKRHPALPSAPRCYPRWDEAMVGGDVGMTEFTLLPHGLRLTSVPLIPMAFSSETRTSDEETFTVTLTPRPDTGTALGIYGNITVECGSRRLPWIRDATDLHACILNYKPSPCNRRGEIQVGRTYVCFLLYRHRPSVGWLKVATDNVLGITCRGAPAEGSVQTSSLFRLSLETTHIRTPQPRTSTRS